MVTARGQDGSEARREIPTASRIETESRQNSSPQEILTPWGETESCMQRTVMAFESMNLLPATSPDAIFSASYCNTPEDIILLWRAARPPPLVIRVPNLRNNIFFGGSLLDPGVNLQNALGAKPRRSPFPFLTLALS